MLVQVWWQQPHFQHSLCITYFHVGSKSTELHNFMLMLITNHNHFLIITQMGIKIFSSNFQPQTGYGYFISKFPRVIYAVNV